MKAPSVFDGAFFLSMGPLNVRGMAVLYPLNFLATFRADLFILKTYSMNML